MISIKKDKDYVKELLKSEEGLHLDFKQSITNQFKISKPMAAFANTSGGRLIIGVSDKKKVVGIDYEEEMFMIEEANRKYITPPIRLNFEVYEIEYIEDDQLNDPLFILIVNIPESSSKPHMIIGDKNHNTLYYRIGDKSLPSNRPDSHGLTPPQRNS
ncbi:AlbA family DNA-binding domain-containing protein [Anditalea andensis]|uniref:Schlafen AlbA-2 domain-containing protein n=1 Tax=Anditalea andensis TaxID=1048983 RepID=A0A074L2H0_9BACT|nr:ATP-binding protein [Anditalea andensis]KEO74063.1 hypothetical protein EL17_07915 [Anditalea andensis]